MFELLSNLWQHAAYAETALTFVTLGLILRLPCVLLFRIYKYGLVSTLHSYFQYRLGRNVIIAYVKPFRERVHAKNSLIFCYIAAAYSIDAEFNAFVIGVWFFLNGIFQLVFWLKTRTLLRIAVKYTHRCVLQMRREERDRKQAGFLPEETFDETRIRLLNKFTPHIRAELERVYS